MRERNGERRGIEGNYVIFSHCGRQEQWNGPYGVVVVNTFKSRRGC